MNELEFNKALGTAKRQHIEALSELALKYTVAVQKQEFPAMEALYKYAAGKVRIVLPNLDGRQLNVILKDYNNMEVDVSNIKKEIIRRKALIDNCTNLQTIRQLAEYQPIDYDRLEQAAVQIIVKLIAMGHPIKVKK